MTPFVTITLLNEIIKWNEFTPVHQLKDKNASVQHFIRLIR